jgi:hypothetical protein
MVSEYKDRKAVVLQWDAGDYDGPVSIHLSSTDDVSSTELVSNPGFAAVTYPLDHVGGSKVEVFDQDGNLLDEGEISVS